MKRKGKAPKNVKKSEEDSSDGDSHVKTFSASETPIRKEPKRSKQAQENADDGIISHLLCK